MGESNENLKSNTVLGEKQVNSRKRMEIGVVYVCLLLRIVGLGESSAEVSNFNIGAIASL